MLLREFFLSALLFLSSVNAFVNGIFDGFIAREFQFPYHALIGCVKYDKSVEWICNGAIINNRFVATAASCVFGCTNFKIRVGTIVHPLNSITYPWTHEPVEYMTKPGTTPYYAPGFVLGNKKSDLALLETNTTIIYSNSVGQVAIPKQNESTLAESTDLVATGFGQPHKSNPYYELQFLTLKVLPNANCSEFFTNAANETMCAKGMEYNRMERGRLCNEFGAPFVLKRDNRTLVGIYQSSADPCDFGGPEEFVPIGPYIRWIWETAKFDTLGADIYNTPKPN